MADMSPYGMFQFMVLNPAMLTFARTSPYGAAWDYFANTPKRDPPEVGRATFAGKTVLITGASSGVGLACAIKLAGYGARVIVTARNEEKGRKTVEEVRREVEGAEVKALNLDLGSWKSIREFGEAVGKEEVHYAILNAGAYHENFHKVEETGWEITTQVHILATAAIAFILLPILARSGKDASSRLLLISSEAHGFAKAPKKGISAAQLLADMQDPQKYKGWERYHLSKMLLNLFMQELSRRLEVRARTKRQDLPVLVACGSPGFVKGTGLFAGAAGNPLMVLTEWLCGRTAEEGARCYVLPLEMEGERFHGKYIPHAQVRKPFWYCVSEDGLRLQTDLYDELLKILGKEFPDLPTDESV